MQNKCYLNFVKNNKKDDKELVIKKYEKGNVVWQIMNKNKK